MLWGRSIPAVCSDFSKNGVNLDHLYQRLNVPVSWIGEDVLISKLMACISYNSKKINLQINEKQTLNSFQNIIKSGQIDFGLLNENFQKQVILKVLSSKENKELMINFNPYLSNPGHIVNSDKLISNNKKAILQNYNKTIYKNNLLEIYKKVINFSVTHNIDKNLLVSFFLKPDGFSLLKWSNYAE